MKLASIIFFGALLAFLTADYLVYFIPKVDYYTQGAEHPDAQEFLRNISELVDATGSPIVEKRIHAGFLRRVDVRPGFRVIHDPELGRELIVKGPEKALAHFEMHEDSDRLTPDFNCPIRLKELVEVRVNLHAHGADKMRINLYTTPPERTTLQPDFVTKGPLQFKFLQIAGIPPHPILVDSRDVVVYTQDDTRQLQGTAQRLEFLFDDKDAPEQVAPDLRAGKTIRTYVGEM